MNNMEIIDSDSIQKQPLPYFVKEIQGDNAVVPFSFANALLGSKKNLYRLIDL